MPLSPALAPTPVAIAIVPELRAPAPLPTSLVRRGAEGVWLIARLAIGYLALIVCERLWIPTRRWRIAMDAWGSRCFTAHVRKHGAMLIKIGQFVASRPDLFPLAYIESCAALRDQAPARPFNVVAAVLDLTYEGRTAAHFSRIDEIAIAAASFGQVHRAWLTDGRMVAIKVQYPGLQRLVAIDLLLTRATMRLLRILVHGFPFHDLLAELERASASELDYLQEATSADRLRPCLEKHGLSAPTIVWEHTREKVLVMEFAPGATLARTDLEALGHDERLRVANAIIDCYLSMLLDEGFYHADPHAGNFVYDAGRIWLIDFGMTGSITKREAELYRRFMINVQGQDTDGMIDVMIQLGFILPEVHRDQLRKVARELYASLKDFAPQALKGSRRQYEIGAKINEMLRRSQGIVFPQHTIMISRATSLLEGLCVELVPDTSFLNLVRPRLQKIITPWSQVRRMLDEAREMWHALRILPDRLAALHMPHAGWMAHATVAGCVLLASTQLQPGVLRDIAIVCSSIAAVASLVRHRRSGF